MTAHIINALLLAGIRRGATTAWGMYTMRCYRPPSTGHEDLYRMYMELQQRITVLEEDYYNRLAQQRRARQEMIHRRPAPVPGVRKDNLDNRAGTR